MPLTRDFRQTVQRRAAAEPAFRAALYQQAVQAILDGDPATGRILLRDLVNATAGFLAIAGRMGTSDKALMRMLSPAGNPQLASLVAMLRALREECDLSVEVQVTPSKHGSRTRVPTKAPLAA